MKSEYLILSEKIRNGEFTSNTSGLCPGFIQGNVVILPQLYAADFKKFCDLNPQYCPLICISQPGEYSLHELGNDIDIRTDVPAYNIFRDGELVETSLNIKKFWQSDMVSFVLGCSFSFEEALMESGLKIRNIEDGTNVSMYKTKLEAYSTKYFFGNYVVSMRPFKVGDISKVIEITSKYPKAHGAPVHVGEPSEIGITDLSKPDFGNPVEIKEDEVPVFWACGVTPQVAINNAKLPLVITHVPGKMLITEKKYEEL